MKSYREERIHDVVLKEYLAARHDRDMAQARIAKALTDRAAALAAGMFPKDPPVRAGWLVDLDEAIGKENLAAAREAIRITSILAKLLRSFH